MHAVVITIFHVLYVPSSWNISAMATSILMTSLLDFRSYSFQSKSLQSFLEFSPGLKMLNRILNPGPPTSSRCYKFTQKYVMCTKLRTKIKTWFTNILQEDSKVKKDSKKIVENRREKQKLEKKRKLRVLCIHGYRQSAKTSKEKLGSFRCKHYFFSEWGYLLVRWSKMFKTSGNWWENLLTWILSPLPI